MQTVRHVIPHVKHVLELLQIVSHALKVINIKVTDNVSFVLLFAKHVNIKLN